MTKQLIGRAEKLSFPELGFIDVAARVDTGAKTSSLWATADLQEDGRLAVVFFGKGHDYHSGTVHYYHDYKQAFVASSNGQSELRYKIKLLVELEGRKIRAHFTLANRQEQAYPVLIGRNILRGKFVVDVSKGNVLIERESHRSKQLRNKPE